MADIKTLDIDGVMFDCVVEGGSNSNGWYRKGRSGLLEQGGVYYVSGTSATVVLPIPYSDTTYTITYSECVQTGTASDSDTDGVDYNIGVSDKKISQFRISKATARGISFYTRGY